MRKFLVIFFLSLYTTGSVLFPGVDWTALQKTYHHCQAEDPDLGVVDFVFDHLLELPDFFESFEKEDEDKNEKPHQPVHHLNFAAQVVVAAPQTIAIDRRREFSYTTSENYPSFNIKFLSDGHLLRLLRPPIV